MSPVEMEKAMKDMKGQIMLEGAEDWDLGQIEPEWDSDWHPEVTC